MKKLFNQQPGIGWWRILGSIFVVLGFGFNLIVAPQASAALIQSGATNVTTGLVVWLPLDETSGTTFGDLSGYGNSATLSGSPLSTAGVVTNAYQFDGASQYATIGYSSSYDLNTFTIMCWVNTTANGGVILSRDPWASWEFALNEDTTAGGSGAGQPSFFNGSSWVTTGTVVNNGTWQHVAVVVSGGTTSFYINGQLSGSSAQSPPPTSTYGITIAQREGGGGGLFFAGSLDDIRIYNRALSAGEIANQFQWRTGAGTLVPITAAGANTYYIDYSTGSDTNSGLFTNAPWKSHPYMASWKGTYTHTNGDQFIFKGGVAWSNACFPMSISRGGSGHGVSDYYGVTNTWYSGGSWQQPIFDAGSTPINSANRFVTLGDNNVTLDNFEMRNFYWNSSTEGYGTGHIFVGTQTNIQILNCIFHAWTHDTTNNGCNDNMDCIIGGTVGYNPGCMASNCVFDGNPNGSDSGDATYCFPIVLNSLIRNLSCALLPNGNPGIIGGNVISNVNKSFSGVHGAAIEPQGQTGTMYFYNNLIRLSAEINIMYRPAATVTNPIYIYNNIICDSVPGCCLLSALNSGSCPAYIVNNLFDSSLGGSYAILEEDGNWSSLVEQNNVEVTGTTTGTFGQHIQDHNLTWGGGQVKTFGTYQSSFLRFNPNAMPFIGSGTNLAGLGIANRDMMGYPRPASGSWDVGPYCLRPTWTSH